MNTIDRIFQYLDFKGDKYSHAEKNLGLSNGYLGKMRARGASIGSEVLEKIVYYYKDINPIWLITGVGEMLNSAEVSGSNNAGNQFQPGPCQQCAIRDKLIAKQEENIDLLKDKIAELNRQLRDKGKSDNIKQTA